MKYVAILHYAGPPTIGGVESTIAYHARGLASWGYKVRILSGTPPPNNTSFSNTLIDTYYSPHFSSTSPPVLRVKSELDRGTVTESFTQLVNTIVTELKSALQGYNVCIAHNVLTFNKNLALTAALASLNNEATIKIVSWCHDLAWTNEQYRGELYDRYPWNLLKIPWQRVKYVTVSEPRRFELAQLCDVMPDNIQVVFPGIDPASFFHWTLTTADLEQRLHLLDADCVLLLPARVTRRKNIELGLQVLAELRKQSVRDFRLVVTGPPGPHNPANPGYLGELLQLRHALQLDEFAHFLYEYGDEKQPLIPDDSTMSNLFQLADLLFFPSIQEGFGIPILEAGLASVPVFCADIPALRATGENNVHYFNPTADSPSDIATSILTFLEHDNAYWLRVRVRKAYRWDAVVRNAIVPLVEGL